MGLPGFRRFSIITMVVQNDKYEYNCVLMFLAIIGRKKFRNPGNYEVDETIKNAQSSA